MRKESDGQGVPLIDIGPLWVRDADSPDVAAVAAQLGAACRELGFFYIVGHGVDEALQARLVAQSQQFFALPLERKLAIAMARGGRAWRGYFPVGGELTSGLPDQKEGIYFGEELEDSHPRVRAGTPLHGRNLFPPELPALRRTVLEYMSAMTTLGHRLMAGIALSLGLPATYFAARYTTNPLTLFRVFNYPPDALAGGPAARWGVGEHTDYGLLTILKQDDVGGLQIKSRAQYLAAPPIPGSFVCNLGDMLDRMTGGLYRSTPHRVQNVSPRNRLSFPFFFDPSWDAEVQPIELPSGSAPPDDRDERWDRASVHAFRGTYGEYLLAKVGKVFPDLQQEVL